MRYVTVRVVDASGRPQANATVRLWVGGITDGFLPPEYTNSTGEAEFKFDEGYSKVAVSVNGRERIPSGSVKAEYKVVL
ncbi:MAG: hypothetical protein JWL77_4000 [Chthonomonadaceae bacterium]|nr:hypothetical protein [Chthonomonadaceae bacterium]